MSFDKPTRNKLAAMVSECRGLLTEDIRDQLQTLYGLQPDGTALAIERLAHLDDTGKEVARELREWQGHLASTELGTESQKKKSAFERVTHETAFTALNRLAALRMCEEREHIIECVRRGMESDGFVLYERLSGGVFGTRGETYRVFLGHVFDELAVDLGALFDRHAPQSLMFPSDRCLEEVLSVLNNRELSDVWQEDETIGWIYQYFNPKEEREAMRSASAAPRNSRELAVRNQFFTPRYVVEFLVDNTLGRIWYEMRKGETALKDACHYLVRRPIEIFLDEHEDAPAAPSSQENLSQLELLKQPICIPHRPKKDPRDLKILDPACGSGHFLLYSFDLLETIYEEAWSDKRSAKSQATGKTLGEEFSELNNLKRALPELILRHNLHGIDIDLRACQIAALALWLRAQRDYQQLGFKPSDRPQITKSNIVCAEPMPGEKQLLDQFVADLEPKVLGQLVQVVFEKMKLAGEAGSLLKIEDEIAGTVADAKKRWLAGPKPEQTILFSDWRPRQTEISFDFSGLTDETFWERAEERIYTELQNYAERAENGHGYQRRLFSEDAAHGFAFIDLCRKRYDSVLMNPPFGDRVAACEDALEEQYGDGKLDLYHYFYERAAGIARDGGFVGAITPRTMLYQAHYLALRQAWLNQSPSLACLTELDLGVLDSATVRPSLVALSKRVADGRVFYCNLKHSSCPDADLLEAVKAFAGGSLLLGCTLHNLKRFASMPGCRFSLWASEGILQSFSTQPTLEPDLGKITEGLSNEDDMRFLRCWWETPTDQVPRWRPFAKFDSRSTFVPDFSVVIDWSSNAYEALGELGNRRANERFYFEPGVAFTRSCEVGMAATTLPSGLVFSGVSRIFLPKEHTTLGLLAYLNTRVVEGLHLVLTPDRDRISGTLRKLPLVVPDIWLSTLEENARELWRRKSGWLQKRDETFRGFVGGSCRGPHEIVEDFGELEKTLLALEDSIEVSVRQHCSLDFSDLSILDGEVRERAGERDLVIHNPEMTTDRGAAGSLISATLGSAFGRWDVRFWTGERSIPNLPDPFDPLPVCPPGMVQNEQGLPLAHGDLERLQPSGRWHYPVDIPWDGILLDDPNHARDIVREVREVLTVIWKDRAEAIEQESCEILGVKDLREYFRKPSLFFADHLKRYSKSRRQAPIYWPLSTASGSYTVWVYYHRLNDDLLYTALNKYVKPKIDATEKELRRIESELPNATGREASALRTTFERTTNLIDELHDFRDELARVAELPYKPNLNDGVLITASPLWRLFRLPKWRKNLEDCWKNLDVGKYDWAHLAYSIWPDRVREVCRRDRSVAIAHGLEELCEVKTKPAKKRRSRKEKVEEAVLGEEG